MIVYRCSVCGYLHSAEAPESCPMCGAPKKAFSEYVAPNVSGTKTAENLAAAFAGESQANRRYTLWRQIAEAENAPEAVLSAFERSANEETAHALSHLIYLGMYGNTSENLSSAADGEAYEKDIMYPEFAEVAEKEGFHDIANYFRAVGKFEAMHNKAYLKAKEKFEA